MEVEADVVAVEPVVDQEGEDNRRRVEAVVVAVVDAAAEVEAVVEAEMFRRRPLCRNRLRLHIKFQLRLRSPLSAMKWKS